MTKRSLLAVLLVSCYAAPSWAAAPPATDDWRVVIIALDAVPYDLVERLSDPTLGEDAIFQGMRGPVPLISTFPSVTSPAMSAILGPFGMGKSGGYEAKFFRHEDNKVRGGGLNSYQRFVFPWRTFFDWQTKGLWKKAMTSLKPLKAGRNHIEQSLEEFIEAPDPVYFVYYDATDLAAHLKGPESLEPLLRELDSELEKLRRRHPEEPFRTILFSDHGMAGGVDLHNARKQILRSLRDAGFETGGQLKEPRDVVVVAFGLLSSVVAFTGEGQEREAAAAMARAEGVDVCVAAPEHGWWVESEEGSARVERRLEGEDVLWSYQPVRGDPLGYAPLVERLSRRHGDERHRDERHRDERHRDERHRDQRHRDKRHPGRWFPDSWWLEESASHRYPDALHRLAHAFDVVENPASVVCGTEEGYMFGSATTNFFSKISVGPLEWTHGALDRKDSLGFLMTDVPGWTPNGAVRSFDALRPLRSLLESHGVLEPPEVRIELASPANP